MGNLKNTFKNVRKEENFFDVTLMCGEEIWKAHKLVLSASSDFFRNIFRKCNWENTVIVLKSTNHSQMSLLLDFIYNGEVQVEQEKLNAFLEAAEELKLKGLTYPKPENDPKIKSQIYAPYSNSSSQLLQSSSNLLQSSDIQPFPSYEEFCKNQEYTEPLVSDTGSDLVSSLGSSDYQAIGELNDKFYEAPDSSFDPSLMRYKKGKWTCVKCGKSDKNKFNIRDHVETHDSDKTQNHFCSSCGKSYKSKNSLRVHKYKIHARDKLIQQLSYVL